MNRFVIGAFAVAASLNGAAAHAKAYALTMTGSVSRLAGYSNGQVTPPPPGDIALGDKVSLRVTFDTSNAILTSLFDVDPAVNIYYLPDAKIGLNIGSYRSRFTPRFEFNAGFQIWNDRPISNLSVDSQSFDFFNYNFAPIRSYPFDIGTGSMSEDITFNNFDFGGTARNSDLLSEIAPFSAFSYHGFSYSLYNSTLGTFALVDANNIQASLSPVPEPASWATMFIGFGLAGAALRRRYAQLDQPAARDRMQSLS